MISWTENVRILSFWKVTHWAAWFGTWHPYPIHRRSPKSALWQRWEYMQPGIYDSSQRIHWWLPKQLCNTHLDMEIRLILPFSDYNLFKKEMLQEKEMPLPWVHQTCGFSSRTSSISAMKVEMPHEDIAFKRSGRHTRFFMDWWICMCVYTHICIYVLHNFAHHAQTYLFNTSCKVSFTQISNQLRYHMHLKPSLWVACRMHPHGTWDQCFKTSSTNLSLPKYWTLWTCESVDQSALTFLSFQTWWSQSMEGQHCDLAWKNRTGCEKCCETQIKTGKNHLLNTNC